MTTGMRNALMVLTIKAFFIFGVSKDSDTFCVFMLNTWHSQVLTGYLSVCCLKDMDA